MRCRFAAVVGVLAAGVWVGAQTHEAVHPAAVPVPVAAVTNPASVAGPSMDDLLTAFQVEPEGPHRTLDDLMKHFEGSDIPCQFVKHPITKRLQDWRVLEQAHSTTGRYSFTINRLVDKDAARASFDDIRAFGHKGGENGVFTICIHKGFESDKVLEMFRGFVPTEPPVTNRTGAARVAPRE